MQEIGFTGHFQPLLGTPCWGVKRGFGRSLSIEFGRVEHRVWRPSLPGQEGLEAGIRAEFGEWHLWLYEADWELGCLGETVVRSWFDPHADLDKHLRVLNGRKLVSVETEDDGAAKFFFDNDYYIRTVANQKGRQRWALKMPSGKVVTVHDGRFTVVEGSDRPEGPWEPIAPTLH